jgi:hypothetical protein
MGSQNFIFFCVYEAQQNQPLLFFFWAWQLQQFSFALDSASS